MVLEMASSGASTGLLPYRQLAAIFFTFLLIIATLLVYRSNFDEDLLKISPKSRYSLEEMRRFALKKSLQLDFKPNYYTKRNLSFNKLLENRKRNRFDIKGEDVLVFLHIQKTAGTSFEKFLVRHLELEQSCDCRKGRKRCRCFRPGSKNELWLFSRFSTGWACGLHADFTELAISGCVDNVLDKREGNRHKRRYFYTTFLRDPIDRFISEFRHISDRGATWLSSRFMCNGKPPTPDQLPMCFDPDGGWKGVNMDEFLSCPYNLAFNRQTRMLADLTLVNCYDTTKMDANTRNRLILASAKRNLKEMSFFGLKERIGDSQWMFENLFGLSSQKRLDEWSKNKSKNTQLSKEQQLRIEERNALDIELYGYAKELFERRLKLMRVMQNQTMEDDRQTDRLEDYEE